jgi:alpha-beta hydrolase superfamily lysophospholipase
VKHLEATFKGAGGLSLYSQSWYPQGSVRAIVVIVHGLGAHSGVFYKVVEYLIPRGYAVYAFDLRGHGRSPGQRGHINAWVEFRDDLNAFLKWIRHQEPGYPCFLWGHSLGGAIALDYVLRSPEGLQGVIVTAPALGKTTVSPLKIMLGRLLSQIWPHFSLRVGIERRTASRDPQVLSEYAQDPLRHEYGSARLATEFFKTVDWIQHHGSDLRIPLLLLHGSEDHVTLPESSWAFCQQIVFSDKECHEYPGGYHDLYADINYQGVLADLVNWLEQHLPRDPEQGLNAVKTSALQI